MARASISTGVPCKKTAWFKSLLNGDGNSSDGLPQKKKKQHEPVPANCKIADKKRTKSPTEKMFAAKQINNRDSAGMVDKGMTRQANEDRVSEKHEGDNGGKGGGVTSKTHVLRGSRGKKRLGTTRVSSLANSMDGDREERHQRKLKKASTFTQKKQLHPKLESAKKNRDNIKVLEVQQKDPATVKAAAARQRRIKKLRARRIATGEHERLQAVKLKRQESFEMARLNRNQRVRMRKKDPTGAATELVSRDEDKARACPAQLSSEEKAKVRKPELERQLCDVSKAKRHLNSPLALIRPQPANYEKERRQQRMQEVLHVLGVEVGDHGKSSHKRQKVDHGKDVPESAAGSGLPHAKSFGETKESHVVDTLTSQVWCEHDAADTSFADGFHNVSEPGSQEMLAESRESGQHTSIAAEIKEEGEVDSPALPRDVLAGKAQDTAEKTIRDETRDMLLDMTPIPRKSTSDTSAGTCVAPFVIPKRSFRNTAVKVEARGMAQVTPAGHHGAVGTHTHVAVKSVLSPASSPQLSDCEPIRLQKMRTKNPVPVKSSGVSTQDKVLMGLARRRNSIFLAAAELEAHPLLANDTTIARYEVCGVDGKMFPDLALRRDCAMKHEIAEDKHLFATSFVGVSLAVPTAKGACSPTGDEYGDTQSRSLNCYKMLRFERPEDREFYQRRMYGATFVPQYLRERETLIMRTARFERKSAGIRFNQDRDREEFAASLSKRYTFKKSEPRCEIPRENWQRITKTQGGAVYLHYRNLEDAKRASYSFRDDAGNPLELKGEHKHRVSSSRGSSPSNGVDCRRTPRRSCSSERSPKKSPSQSSQGGSAQRDRQRTVPTRYSRYDRPLSAQREDGYSLYSREYRTRSRSRSRSRPELFPDQQLGAVARGSGTGTGNEAVMTGSSAALSSAERQGSNSTNDGDKNTGGNVQTEPGLLMSSPRAVTQDKSPSGQEIESGEEQEEGEIESSAVFIPEANDHSKSKAGNRRRSPLQNWQQSYDERSYQRQESYRGRLYEQQYWRRSRSRSRPRPDGHRDRGRPDNDWDGSYAKESGHDDYNSERRPYLGDMDRHGGRDYHDGGYDDSRGAYSRSYY
ncbi:hypothetical protein V7S43_014095 [Phytophthora oleae]|uniref:Uncharacterized protein n=1 Tax=Phytophthora oleae TaxID=2107226 RepID=A0ABD3F3W4_9STRA